MSGFEEPLAQVRECAELLANNGCPESLKRRVHLPEVLAALDLIERHAQEMARERNLIGAALGEPCAECGHIDWRSDGYADNLVEAAEARAAELESALRDGIGFVRTGGPLYTAEREELLEILSEPLVRSAREEGAA